MSYQVTARKWRPQMFAQMVGQEHVSQTLLNALRSSRIPHALLFTGPRGTGKTSTARIIAKSLRCPNSVDFVPCNACSECDDISQSRSVDVMEIDGASHNGVDAVRELRDSVAFMPSTGKYRIYIIDEVHMLTGSAFNALLKTLEEPPAHVLFIFATTEIQKIPNTVLSRCQRYDFRKISTRLISDHLQKICSSEGIKAEPEALWIIARQADGSMRDSQSLLDQVVNFCKDGLTVKDVVGVLGLTDRLLLTETLDALIRRDQKQVINLVERLMVAGYDPLVFVKDLLEEVRHALLIKIGGGQVADLVDLPDEEISRIRDLSGAVSEEDLHLLFDMALKGANDLHRSQDPRIVLEMLLLRMSVAPRVMDILAVPTKNPPSQTAAPVKAPKKSSATQAESPKPLPSNNEDQWMTFVDKVRKVNGLFAAQIEHVHLLSVEGREVRLGIPEKYKFIADSAKDPAFQRKIVSYLNTFWGPDHRVAIEAIDPSKSGTLSARLVQEKKESDSQDEVRKQVENHPLVREAKSIFNTEIKSIREK